jgi:hypothetical protein
MTTALKILTLIFQLLPLIKQVVLAVEAAFGPKTGPTKKEVVLNTILDVLTSTDAAGEIPADVLTSVLSRTIDRQVAGMNAVNQLPK